MKIIRGDGCDKFEPYNVTITVETLKEQNQLRAITHANCSVPQAVVDYKSDSSLYQPTASFLKKFQRALKRSNDDD